MNHRKLTNLKTELATLRKRGGVKSSELEDIAKSLGRKRHKRGKEPTWINEQFPNLRPLSIPHHSTDLNRFTARSILEQLEVDIEYWEEFVEASEVEGGSQDG
jgi:hypothetical protein